MKKFVVALAGLAILLFSATMAEAQDADVRKVDAYPFTKHVMSSQEEYTRAVETCDQSVLYVDCNQMTSDANELWKLGLGIPPENEKEPVKSRRYEIARMEFAKWMRQLSERPCPRSGIGVLARVVNYPGRPSTIQNDGTHRQMKEGERCLFDLNSSSWVMSLTCGNFITGGSLPFTIEDKETTAQPARPIDINKQVEDLVNAKLDEMAKQAALKSAQPPPLVSQPQPQPAPQPQPVVYQEPPRHKSKKGKVAAIVVGAAVGTGVAICAVNHCWETTVIQTTTVTVR